MLLGALEAGGTKMVCALGNEKGEVFERESFPTREPEPTVSDIISYFAGRGIEALGVSSFGPLDLNEDSSTYGSITTTPKPGWQNVPLRARLMDALGVPVGIDTDVNGAALGEALLGAGKGLKSLVYYTIGTGVGGGAYDHGRLLHGLVHPEMGHMLLRPHADDPAPHGFCPYHDGCLEGMACGKAIEQRWGVPARELPPEHIAWQIEAEYSGADVRQYHRHAFAAAHRAWRRCDAPGTPVPDGAQTHAGAAGRLRRAPGDSGTHRQLYRTSGAGQQQRRGGFASVGSTGIGVR